MLSKLNIYFLIFGLLVCANAFQYKGYKIYKVIAQTQEESDFLNVLSEQTDEIDFFSLSKLQNVPAVIMVPPKYQPDFENALSLKGLQYNIMDADVSKSIQNEKIEGQFWRSFAPPSGDSITFDRYHRFDEINNYLEKLSSTYSSRVKVATVGKSFEGRSLKSITITNGDNKPNKKVIFMDAGIHAREWIAPAVALKVIQQLVENFEENKNLLASYDWVIIPVVNPDGYEYTHTDSRFWRKTRQPGSAMCKGTDGNRNFDFHWGEVGASPSACSDTFRGKTPFSEPETQIVRDIMHSLTGHGKMYLTLHSYGNYLLYPWGYTSNLPETWKDIDEVAQAGAKAISSFSGSRYRVGSSTNVLYAAAGGSDDYALGVAKIPVSITMELPAGGSGFDPRPSQIKQFVDESWIGINAMANKVIEKY